MAGKRVGVNCSLCGKLCVYERKKKEEAAVAAERFLDVPCPSPATVEEPTMSHETAEASPNPSFSFEAGPVGGHAGGSPPGDSVVAQGESPEPFKPGDIVVFMSGGPFMTVTRVYGDGSTVACMWMTPGGEVKAAEFSVGLVRDVSWQDYQKH